MAPKDIFILIPRIWEGHLLWQRGFADLISSVEVGRSSWIISVGGQWHHKDHDDRNVGRR